MVSKPIIILNCRSTETLLPALQKTLQAQNLSFDLKLLESKSCPSRLSQITDENRIYFFLDEDIELPGLNYLEEVVSLFSQNSALLFLGGKYLFHADQPYLAKAYNSQIELWLFPQNQKEDDPIPCQNLPGGVWIISGRIKKFLHDWKEPDQWAGEDTFSIRWLQKKGVQVFYHQVADVFHHPRNHFIHFCKRAFLQGYARAKLQLKSENRSFPFKLAWKYRLFWPGWLLHQVFVELGGFCFSVRSLIAKITPVTSPTA